MRRIYFIITLVSLSLLSSCETAMEKNSKYQRPVWLEGKLFTVAQSVPELSIFSECLKRSGYDALLDKSGLYTLMAPTDDAFADYFALNNYQSLDDIDSIELKRLVEIHIVKNPWSKDQLRELNTSGWIDEDDDDIRYTGYKRETMYQPNNKVYKVIEVTGGYPIISASGSATRVVYSAYNKYVPLFYKEYMDYSEVAPSDFEFYYDRPFQSSEIYYGGAQLLNTGEDLNEDGVEDDYYVAENGYVYLIDRVVEPLMSADELLFDSNGTYKYSSFGNLINEYAKFSINETATNAQAGATEGADVDNLYNITFSNLAFNIANENTHSNASYSIAFHNALFAPTNTAMSEFENNVIGRGNDYYGGFSGIPNVLKTLIVNYHMARYQPYYPSQAGSHGTFYNAADSRVDLDGIGIVQKEYGSNCTFVGMDKVIMPDIFSSVAGPVIIRPDYFNFFASIYYSGLFTVLQSLTTDYSLFAIPDEAMDADSSLFITYTDDIYSGFKINSCKTYNRELEQLESLPVRSSEQTSLTSLINGQIALGTNKGVCRKEFLRTLSGYYISFDNEDGTVWGGDSTTVGIYSDSIAAEIKFDTELAEDFGNSYGYAPVNGKTYSVNYWMQFPKETFDYSKLKIDGNHLFYDLINSAGLLSTTNRLNFLTEGEALTVFVPTDAALLAVGADTLPHDELKELLLSHFVTGLNMFTDNILRYPLVDGYFTVNDGLLHLGSSEADKIDIYDKNGTLYFQVEENDEKTNIMYLGWDDGDETDGNTFSAKSQVGISVIVHLVDDVIQPDIVF